MGLTSQVKIKGEPKTDASIFLDRYVERDTLRAGLVRWAEDWPRCSLACRLAGGEEGARRLHDWPVARLTSWPTWVNEAQSEAEREAVRGSVVRGQPMAPRRGSPGR